MTTRKLWVALVAMATLSALVVATGSPANASTTADRAVRSLERAGILAGTNCSSEVCDGDLLRWEAAVWFAKALDLKPDADETVAVADVPADSGIAGAVGSVAREGVTVGCATGPFRFCGNSHTTRAQMASFLTRAFDLRASRRTVFTDIDRDSVHARNVSAIRRAGISTGCATGPPRYCPDNPISRRDAAVMLYRALQRDDADSDQSQRGSDTGNSGSGNTGPRDSGSNNPGSGTTTPVARPACPVVDHVNTHHDIDDHHGDPFEISYALLPDGTLFGHRHFPDGRIGCWMWAPPDEDGNGSFPVDALPPTHSH